MPAPRPYGVGPYGTGHYSRYAGELYEVGGVTSCSFAAKARARRVLQTNAGVTGIAFATQASERVVHCVDGAAGIAFTPLALGVTLVIRPWATTQIVFTVVHSHLDLSWADSDVCEAGAWSPADPCEPGGWLPPAEGEPGDWTPAQPGDGAWAPPPGCSDGTWQAVRT